MLLTPWAGLSFRPQVLQFSWSCLDNKMDWQQNTLSTLQITSSLWCSLYPCRICALFKMDSLSLIFILYVWCFLQLYIMTRRWNHVILFCSVLFKCTPLQQNCGSGATWSWDLYFLTSWFWSMLLNFSVPREFFLCNDNNSNFIRLSWW